MHESANHDSRDPTVPEDRFDLARFLAAQQDVYAQVVDELRSGRKTTHWMWFVFPQFSGLGLSPMAHRYAINSLEEARHYLHHPVWACVSASAPTSSTSFKAAPPIRSSGHPTT